MAIWVQLSRLAASIAFIKQARWLTSSGQVIRGQATVPSPVGVNALSGRITSTLNGDDIKASGGIVRPNRSGSLSVRR